MTPKERIKAANIWIGFFAWFLFLAQVVAIPLTINMAMNGLDAAVIDITPRNATESVKIPAIGPCGIAWMISIFLIVCIVVTWRNKKRLQAIA